MSALQGGDEGGEKKTTAKYHEAQITTHVLKAPLVNPNGEGAGDPGFTSTSDYAKNKSLPVYRGIFKG